MGLVNEVVPPGGAPRPGARDRRGAGALPPGDDARRPPRGDRGHRHAVLTAGLSLEAESGARAPFEGRARGAARFAGGEGRGGAGRGRVSLRHQVRPLAVVQRRGRARDRGPRPAQELRRRSRRVRGRVLRGAARRGVRPARARTAPGKTTTVEILEGYRERSAARCACSGHDPGDRDRELRERVGIVLQSCGFYPRADRPRGRRARWPRPTPTPRGSGETIALVGLEDKADARSKHALGRPAAAAGPGAGAGRRPRADLPRRADHRLRPRRPPRRLGRGPHAAGSWARPCC